MFPSNTMLPPVPTTLPGTPLTSPAVPWNVIEFTVGTTGVGTMDDGRSAAGGAKKSRPVGLESRTPPSTDESGFTSATRSWYSGVTPSGSRNPTVLPYRMNPLGSSPRRSIRYWKPSLVTAHTVDWTRFAAPLPPVICAR